MRRHILIVCIVFLALIVVVSPAIAAISISLNAEPPSVGYGSPVRFSGHITRDSSTVVKGQKVVVSRVVWSYLSRGWIPAEQVGTGVIKSNGDWELLYTPTKTANYRASVMVLGKTLAVSNVVNVVVTGVPGITVTSPNGGESWSPGTLHNIMWTYTGDVGSVVRVELVKGGVLDRQISASAPIGSNGAGSLEWAVPLTQTPGSNYRVRITSTSKPEYSDISDNTFSIPERTPSITVVNPNGGERLMAGFPYFITWKYRGNPGSSVDIYLMKGEGIDSEIEMGYPIDNVWLMDGKGEYEWNVPKDQEYGTDYKILIISSVNAAYSDKSDKPFTIEEMASLSVVSPRRGEIFYEGDILPVQWTHIGDCGSTVVIESQLRPDEKTGYWDIIGENIPIGNEIGDFLFPLGVYHHLPQKAEDMRVRVRSITNSLCNDESEYFKIIDPRINIYSPRYNEIWYIGTTNKIAWSYSGNPGTSVNIALHKDMDGQLFWINRNVPIGSDGMGSYDWPITPDFPTGHYRMEVTSNAYPDYVGVQFLYIDVWSIPE